MTMDIIRRGLLFVAFVLGQAFVLQRIHLFGVATPLLYVYFVLLFPRSYPKWASLLWAFFLGLAVDIFTNTPGVAAASLTLTAAVQPYILELFVPRDAAENFRPRLSAIGPAKYFTYATVLTLLFCLVFFSLEMFSFFDWLHWLLCIVGSTVLTVMLVLTFEIARGEE